MDPPCGLVSHPISCLEAMPTYFLFIFFCLATLLYSSLFSEGDVIILGGKILCQHFVAHGEKINIGKTFWFDQLQDLISIVAQRFTNSFDVFKVKELLENQGFSDNAQSAIKYFTLIMYKNVRFRQ